MTFSLDTGDGARVPIREASRNFMQAAERSTTLYALSAEYREVLDILESGENDTDLLDNLDRIGGAIQHKAENIAGLMQWCKGLADMRKAEAKRMAESAETFERRADRLREYLLRNMLAIECDRIDTARFSLSVRQNPPKVEVLEPSLVPSEFQRTTVKVDVDKKAVTDHFKQTGEVVPGCEITRGQRLEVK